MNIGISKNSNCPIGLDISDLSLKFVQLEKTKNGIGLRAMGKTDLPPGAIEGGEIRNRRVVIGKLKEMLSAPKLGSVTSNSVVACLPETKTFIKLIKVERKEGGLSETIEPEMEKYIPMAGADMCYDWQVIGEDQNGWSALVGVAPKTIVSQYIDFLREAGLCVSALEIESAAICRALLPEESPLSRDVPGKNYGIIDIGAKRSSMIIYSKNTIAMAVSIPIANHEVTEKIAKTLEIKTDQAEKAKIICGLDKERARGIISEILSDTIAGLNRKISEIMEFYGAHYPERGKLDEIILCGGGANIKNIDRIIEQAVSAPVRIGNVFLHLDGAERNTYEQQFLESHNLKINFIADEKKTKQPKDISVKQSTGPVYATAIGLALRDPFIGHK